MRKDMVVSFKVVTAFMLLLLISGCGSANKEGGPAVSQTDLVNAAKLGNANCLQCHNAGKDLTMLNDLDTRTIGGVYQDSVHFNPLFDPNNNGQDVGCESCHGGGQFHWGLGPLAYPVPDYKVCQTCHKPPLFDDPTVFAQTAHANTDQTPDKFFFQGGVGTGQASLFGVPEVVNGTTTPVTKNQHIEECSVCHNSNWRFVYDNDGKLLHPDPANMPDPTVSCANCHDAHQVGKIALVTTRPAGSNPQGNVVYPIFRKSQIAGEGAWNRPEIRPLIPGTFNLYTTAFTTTELICAACHTKGLYKYGQTQTHQSNVFSQWSSSAHGAKTEVPWNDFSGKLGVGHRTRFPVDLGLAVAAAGTNGGAGPTSCLKCHNGLSSIDFQGPIDTATRRPTTKSIIWGAASAVCITCHDPHANSTGRTKNVRVPVVMTNYSGAGVGTFMGNVFLDTQPVPASPSNPNATVCIFCHQGRESGLTLFKDKLAPGRTITGNFKNAHYLGTAAMLWGVNAYEYAPTISGTGYTANFAHQSANCTTCHMNNETEPVRVGGHTWRPNGANCNGCHAEITAATDLSLENGAGFLATNALAVNSTNYSGNPASVSIAQQIRDLQNYIIALLASQTPAIYYDDTTYPYFFNVAITVPNGTANNHASANAFTAWTLPTYKAAFNLGIAVKGLPSAGVSPTNTYVSNGGGVTVPDTSQTNFPNKSAAVHDYKYIIQVLFDSYTDLYNNSTAGQITAAQVLLTAGTPGLTLPTPATLNANRPAGTRQAVNYGAFVPGPNPVVTYGGTYNANQ